MIKNYNSIIDVDLDNLEEFIVRDEYKRTCKNIIDELKEKQINNLIELKQKAEEEKIIKQKKEEEEYEKYLRTITNIKYFNNMKEKHELIENFDFDIEVIANKKYLNKGLEPSIYAKRLKNLLKLKSQGILDERIDSLTKPEIELIYFGILK